MEDCWSSVGRVVVNTVAWIHEQKEKVHWSGDCRGL